MIIFKRFLITLLLVFLGACSESQFDKCFKVEREKVIAKYYVDHIRLFGGNPTPGPPVEKVVARKAKIACNAHGLYE